MNLDSISQVATSVGAVIAGVSLVAVFLLYRITQRDELASQFHLTIAALRPNVEQVLELVSFELAHELANTAVHSRALELPLQDLFAYCRPETGKHPSKEELTKYLDENFPVITVPLDTPLASQYRAVTTKMATEVAPYQTSFPGIYRIANSIVVLLANCLRSAKRITRNEELWEKILPDLIEQDKRITSVQQMKRAITEKLIGLLMVDMRDSQEKLEPLTGMLDLAGDVYLSKTPRELKRLSRAEKKEKVRSTTQTKTIPEDLEEAEKCLKHAFAKDDDRQSYKKLLVAFEHAGVNPEDLSTPDAEASKDGAGAGGAQGEEEDDAAADGHDPHLAADYGQG